MIEVNTWKHLSGKQKNQKQAIEGTPRSLRCGVMILFERDFHKTKDTVLEVIALPGEAHA